MKDNNDTNLTLTEAYESAETAAASAFEGLWKVALYTTINSKDTTRGNDGTNYKIYFAGHFIWGSTQKDSSNTAHSAIGFGPFTTDGTASIKESINACTFSTMNGQVFDLAITMNGADEFTQIISNKDGSKDLTVYQRVKK